MHRKHMQTARRRGGETDDGQVPSPAILYAAKSSPDERESIPDQLRDGREFAAREGLAVAGEYAEQNVSAYKGDRGPQLAAALEHAGRLSAALIVQHSDRLARGDGRNARHLAELYFAANRAGVTLRSVQDDSTFDSPILAAVMGERNMEDSRRKSAAVRAGHARRRKRGQFPGGPAPYGYLRERGADDELVLSIDPERAPIVRRVFAEYVAGQPQLSIARALAADGVPTANGGRWQQATVANLLGNPAYAGLLRDGDGFCEGRHEAIIDRATWERALALREAKARTHKRGRNSVGRHLFRKGFLHCAKCDSSMIPRTARNGSGKMRETYVCAEHLRDPDACSMPPILRADIDPRVFAYFESVGLDVDATRAQLAAAVERRTDELRSLLAIAEREAQAAHARLDRVKRDYTNGELTAAEWRELRAELEPEASAADAEVTRLAEQLEDAEAGTSLAAAEDDVLAQLAHIRAAVAGEVADAEGVAAVRAALLRLFDHFVLHDDPPPTAHVELIGKRWIEPVVSSRAIEGFDEQLKPILSREALGATAENNSKGSF